MMEDIGLAEAVNNGCGGGGGAVKLPTIFSVRINNICAHAQHTLTGNCFVLRGHLVIFSDRKWLQFYCAHLEL